jgi:hypothetical protein
VGLSQACLRPWDMGPAAALTGGRCIRAPLPTERDEPRISARALMAPLDDGRSTLAVKSARTKTPRRHGEDSMAGRRLGRIPSAEPARHRRRNLSCDGPAYATGPMRGHWPPRTPNAAPDLRSPS